jgi:hypothetical protein
MPAIHAGMTMIFISMFCGRASANETLRGSSQEILTEDNERRAN